MATKKLEVVVSGPHGVGVLSNAFAFSVLLPRDGDLTLEKHTPAEEESQRFLDAATLGSRAPGTNAAPTPGQILTSASILFNVNGTNAAADSVTRTTTRVGPKEGPRDEYELLRGLLDSFRMLIETPGPHGFLPGSVPSGPTNSPAPPH